jgi:hypothetical protein
MRQNRDDLVALQSSLPLFFHVDWLDFVCGTNNWEALIYADNTRVKGVFTYALNGSRIFSPVLATYMGPYLIEKNITTKEVATVQMKFQEFILENIQFDYFEQRWHPHFHNHIAFFQHGFKQQTRYTYVLKELHKLQTIWSNFKTSLRSDIQRAAKQLIVTNQLDSTDFFALLDVTFQNNKVKNPYSFELIQKLLEYISVHQCGKLYVAKNNAGTVTNVILVLWDSESAYYLMSASEPTYKKSNGNSLLLWHAIQDMSNYTNRFDFEGSMLLGIENYVRAFGGDLVPFHHIFKSNNSLLRLILNRFKS